MSSNRLLAIIVAVFLVFLFVRHVAPKPCDQVASEADCLALSRMNDIDSARDRQDAGRIVLENYTPSYAMLNPGVDAINGRWSASREGINDRCNGNCWLVEYTFQIVDAQGSAHKVECEWDVDLGQRTAVPRNEQARYYWSK